MTSVLMLTLPVENPPCYCLVNCIGNQYTGKNMSKAQTNTAVEELARLY